ncbi:unnamed protein product [Cylicocyclus nassatus]|uniref:Uncharacterized protein n=1 Tax=Cylicocyclus nassatus TaxID=53992 RepID=A0AA36DSG2_CYLNA|nr:unnamed protein product [Cylicocyclus nassatus]
MPAEYSTATVTGTGNASTAAGSGLLQEVHFLSACLLHWYAGHGIYTATSPIIYDFIPTNKKEIKKPKAKMYDAALIFVARTRDAIEQILKWLVLCALEERCMAGTGNESLPCRFGNRFSDEPRCHRFDQSVVNLLAANAFWYDRHYYEISDNCKCVDTDGSNYDFCYHLPENRSVHGRRFSCQYLPALKKLGLLDTSGLSLIWKQSAPVFVTAFSNNHQHEALNLVKSVAKYFLDQRMIIYDLGNVDSNQFKEWKFLEFRKFNFEDYPGYVASLTEFRWKPLVIAETLLEFGAIWYMDSSVVFKKSDLNHVYELVKCREIVKERPPLLSSEERDERENRTAHESGWEISQWRANLAECRKINQQFLKGSISVPRLHGTWHLYCHFSRLVIEMTITLMVSLSTGDESLFCNFKDRFSDEPTCHRFDQSVVNLLAANAFWYDRHYYVSEIVDFFNIMKGG